MPFYFKVIPETAVTSQLRERARVMLDYCQKTLGLSGLTIEWTRKSDECAFNFADTLARLETMLKREAGDYSDAPAAFKKDKDEFLGQFQTGAFKKNRILIRSDIPEREILWTIAHECQHRRDDEDYRPPFTGPEKVAWEKRADSFAGDAMSELELAPDHEQG